MLGYLLEVYLVKEGVFIIFPLLFIIIYHLATSNDRVEKREFIAFGFAIPFLILLLVGWYGHQLTKVIVIVNILA